MSSSRSRRALRNLAGAVALVAAVLGLAACGVGVGSGEQQHVGLLVTRDFGRVPVGGGEQTVEAPSSDTAMRLLQRTHRVRTRYGGGFVQSIDGIGGGTQGGRPVDWFFYVNGLIADKGAASVKLHRGDRVWWDRHDWGTTPDVKAVVGAFPEPFLHGRNGKRLPVRMECGDADRTPCDIAARTLSGAGIGVVARARIGTTGGTESLRVLVGRWSEIRGDFAARQLERGPGTSGVYARPTADGRTIALLDARGRTVRTAAPGTGLIAATRYLDQGPVWVVTGADDAGVRQAAAALTEDALDGKFAVAIRNDLPTALPVQP